MNQTRVVLDFFPKIKLHVKFCCIKCSLKVRMVQCKNCSKFVIKVLDMNIYSPSTCNIACQDIIFFNCEVESIVYTIFICHFNLFENEQGIFKMPGKVMFDSTKHCAMIKLWVDLGKTLIKTKLMIRETVNHQNILRSLIYKWHKRFSDEVCDCKLT